MPYINPALLIQDRFKSPLESVLPIVPSFMANKRAQEQLAFQQAQALAGAPLRQAQTQKYLQDIKLDPRRVAVQEAANVGLPEYRGAQTKLAGQQAEEKRLANELYNKIMGGIGPEEGKERPYGISTEEFIRSKLNLPQRQMVTGYDKESKTYSRQPDKPGLVTKPETGKMHTLNYWMPGESMSSQIVPIEDYDQTVAAIRKAGGIIGTQAPLPIRLKELKETQKVRNEARLSYLTAALKARGIDPTKFNQQQQKWYDVIKFMAGIQADGINANWRLSVDDMAIANRNLMIDTINQIDLINAGQPPSWLSKGKPTERPFESPGRKEGQTEEKYQQRVQQTTPYRAVPPVQQYEHTATNPQGQKVGWDGQKWVPIQ